MQFAKHIHVLHLLSTIPSGEERRRNGEVTHQEGAECWDHMFEYIHANWAEPASMQCNRKYLTQEQENEIENCRIMLSMDHETLLAKLETLPPYFTEALFPVAIGRYLLRDLNLPIRHRDLKTFSEFHRRYGVMVISS